MHLQSSALTGHRSYLVGQLSFKALWKINDKAYITIKKNYSFTQIAKLRRLCLYHPNPIFSILDVNLLEGSTLASLFLLHKRRSTI